MTKPISPAGQAPSLYLDVVQPITSGGATHVDSLLVVCGVHQGAGPIQHVRVPAMARTITLADFEIQRRTPAGAPDTGSDGRAAPLHRHGEGVRKRAWHVESPAENPAPHVDADCCWTAYMRMGVSQLMTCHAIYLLPGWQQSKGASLEYMVAQQLGLAVYEHAKQDDVLQEQLQQLASKPSLRPEQQPIPA